MEQDYLDKSELNDQVTDIKVIAPNPANKEIGVDFYLDTKSDVEIQVIDIAGFNRLQKSVGFLPAGYHSHKLSVESLNSGIYICRLKSGGKVINKQLIVAK